MYINDATPGNGNAGTQGTAGTWQEAANREPKTSGLDATHSLSAGTQGTARTPHR